MLCLRRKENSIVDCRWAYCVSMTVLFCPTVLSNTLPFRFKINIIPDLANTNLDIALSEGRGFLLNCLLSIIVYLYCTVC